MSKEDKVRKLLSISRNQEYVDQYLENTFKEFRSIDREIVNEIRAQYNKRKEEYMTMMESIYMEVYSEIEIDSCIEFYASSIGQMLLNKSRLLEDVIAVRTERWWRNLGDGVIDSLDEKGVRPISAGEN